MSSSPNTDPAVVEAVDLRLDWCDYAAAKWAIQHWYYRPVMPIGKLVKIGVWEDGEFAGVVIFGTSVSNALGKRWGLSGFQCCELSRLALKPGHRSQVSRVVRVALIFLRKHCPGLKAVVSFADPALHHGGVYKAGGWLYTGTTAADRRYTDSTGHVWHSREVKERGWDRTIGGKVHKVPKPSECTIERIPGKHRYVMPLDEPTRAKIMPFTKAPPRMRTEPAPEV